MKKVLVTGITGKSGVFLLESIISNIDNLQNYFFGFIIRNKDKAKDISEKVGLCSVYVGDLNDEEFLSMVFSDGYTTLLHIAGIQKSLKITRAAINGGVTWLILVHTTGIYSKYKAAGEEYRQIESEISRMIHNKNVDLTILRPTMIYGNMNDRNISVFIKMVDKLRWFPVVDGAKYELQPVWCGDLGKAYYQVLMNPERTRNRNYNLSGGEPIKLIDIFKTIASYLNVKNKFVSFPFWISYTMAILLYVCSFSKIDFREKVQRLVEPRVFDHDDATKDFGYNPVPFNVGVKSLIDEYKNSKIEND